MQRLKKSSTRLLSLALVIFSLGCGSAPRKPAMLVCIPDVPAMEVICGWTKEETWKSITTAKGLTVKTMKQLIIEKSTLVERYPISKIDRGICLDQLNSNILIDYMHDLENYIKYQCKQNLDGDRWKTDSL